MSSYPNEQFQVDLISMQNLSQHNNNTNYILTVIDVFSKFAYAYPIKRKTGNEVTQAFKQLFKKAVPKYIQSDKGQEFLNKSTQSLFKEHNIKWYNTENELKSVIVERFNRSLRDLIGKYLTAQNTKRWIDVLDSLIHNYNTRCHRSFKMTPKEASKLENSGKVYSNLYPFQPSLTKKPTFKIGDFVRISKDKGKFRRGFKTNFTSEVFVITDVLNTNPITYQVAEIRNADKIIGTFYPQELSLFTPKTAKDLT